MENEELKPYRYITYEDCESICKSMRKNDPSKGMIIVSAPKGTTLEVL